MVNYPFFERTRRWYARYPVLFQLVGWLAFIVLPDSFISFPQVFNQQEALKLFSIRVINNLLGLLIFYVNFYFLTPYLLRRNRLVSLIPIMLLAVSLIVIINRWYYDSFIKDDVGVLTAKLAQMEVAMIQQDKPLGVPFPLAVTSALMMVVMLSISSGLVIARDRTRYQVQHQQMLIEKKEAELNALKLQISPHFLFNTLNNMRWLARQKSDLTEDAILRLSDILRYMIYQVERGPVALAREIDYLTDYIELQQLRLAPHNQVVFEKNVDDDRILIEPLLLIHFVENAFKHGIHHNEPSTITIRLTVADGALTFSTRNQLFVNGSAVLSADSGIGIQNVERRLNLHYPHRHLLRMYHQNGLFCVDLRIELASHTHETARHSY